LIAPACSVRLLINTRPVRQRASDAHEHTHTHI
jgi:hypothetical protein